MPEHLVNMAALSDYMWRYLAHVGRTEPYRFSAREIGRAVQETDRGFLFWQLQQAEKQGLATRSRAGVSDPWLWELTPAGQAALDSRAGGSP